MPYKLNPFTGELDLVDTTTTPETVATQYDTDSGSAVPASHILNILGTTAVAGTSPLTTSGATDTVTITAQISQAIASADATKIGLSNFDSGSFAVDADGFVTYVGPTGDVVGPGSATDNALARYDGTTGKLLQDSTVIVNDNGQMTNASQVSFQAYSSAVQSNVTGDGTIYTVQFQTERYDVGSVYNTATGIFTAPVTGKYHITSNAELNQINATVTDFDIRIVTSNKTYLGFRANIGVLELGLGYQANTITVIADMEASDTAYVAVALNHAAGKTADVPANVNSCWISGILIS